MEKLVRIALAALFLLGIASAQSLPSIDVFGGYSYLNLQLPQSVDTNSQRLNLNGGEGSATVTFFHHLGVEADFSGHILSDCASTSLNCSNFTYLFGPRFTIGDHSSKITAFVHGLVGQDRETVPDTSAVSLNDTSVAVGGGGGLDYWISRRVGIQLGPFDYIYTHHLQDDAAPSQGNYRAAVGIAFRFGGNLPPIEPKAPKEAQAESNGGHRSLIRPWHKSAPEGQPTSSQPGTVAGRQPAPLPAGTLSHGMSVQALGVTVAPQEFDGAKILSIAPGSIAEMASLHPGDLIRSIDGKAVRTPMELAAELYDKTGKVRIGIQRGTFATETVIILPSR
jgi:hypothetical protein